MYDAVRGVDGPGAEGIWSDMVIIVGAEVRNQSDVLDGGLRRVRDALFVQR